MGGQLGWGVKVLDPKAGPRRPRAKERQPPPEAGRRGADSLLEPP